MDLFSLLDSFQMMCHKELLMSSARAIWGGEGKCSKTKQTFLDSSREPQQTWTEVESNTAEWKNPEVWSHMCEVRKQEQVTFVCFPLLPSSGHSEWSPFLLWASGFSSEKWGELPSGWIWLGGQRDRKSTEHRLGGPAWTQGSPERRCKDGRPRGGAENHFPSQSCLWLAPRGTSVLTVKPGDFGGGGSEWESEPENLYQEVMGLCEDRKDYQGF